MLFFALISIYFTQVVHYPKLELKDEDQSVIASLYDYPSGLTMEIQDTTKVGACRIQLIKNIDIKDFIQGEIATYYVFNDRLYEDHFYTNDFINHDIHPKGPSTTEIPIDNNYARFLVHYELKGKFRNNKKVIFVCSKTKIKVEGQNQLIIDWLATFDFADEKNRLDRIEKDKETVLKTIKLQEENKLALNKLNLNSEEELKNLLDRCKKEVNKVKDMKTELQNEKQKWQANKIKEEKEIEKEKKMIKDEDDRIKMVEAKMTTEIETLCKENNLFPDMSKGGDSECSFFKISFYCLLAVLGLVLFIFLTLYLTKLK